MILTNLARDGREKLSELGHGGGSVPVAVKIRFNQRERDEEFNRVRDFSVSPPLPAPFPSFLLYNSSSEVGRTPWRRYVFDAAGWIHNRVTLATLTNAVVRRNFPRGIYDRSLKISRTFSNSFLRSPHPRPRHAVMSYFGGIHRRINFFPLTRRFDSSPSTPSFVPLDQFP